MMKFKDGSLGGSSADFVKLKSGESISGVFRGEPYDFKQHWVTLKGDDGKEVKSTVHCAGIECPSCKQGLKATFRFRLNFIVNEEGTYKAKVFEQGRVVYETLRGMSRDYDLEKTSVKITRNGDSLSTTYTILPLPNGQVTEKLEGILSGVALINLVDPGGDEGAHEDSEVPF